MQLGARIASLRKEQSITQVQLAELLKVSQQTINAYEVGRRRMPVSSLPLIARYLGVSIEELIGEPPSPGASQEASCIGIPGLCDRAVGNDGSKAGNRARKQRV